MRRRIFPTSAVIVLLVGSFLIGVADAVLSLPPYPAIVQLYLDLRPASDRTEAFYRKHRTRPGN